MQDHVEQAVLGLAGVSRRYAFNGDGYYVRARLFAFIEPGGIVMRPPEPQRTSALARQGARTWTMPRTSLRHDWVYVPFGEAPAEELIGWLAAARDHVAGMDEVSRPS